MRDLPNLISQKGLRLFTCETGDVVGSASTLITKPCSVTVGFSSFFDALIENVNDARKFLAFLHSNCRTAALGNNLSKWHFPHGITFSIGRGWNLKWNYITTLDYHIIPYKNSQRRQVSGRIFTIFMYSLPWNSVSGRFCVKLHITKVV